MTRPIRGVHRVHRVRGDHHRLRRVLALICVVLLVAACAPTGAPSTLPTPATSVAPLELWPLPDDPMGLAREAGLEPLPSETLEYHLHAHLDVFRDGRPVIVPAGIGIDIDDPGVKRFDGPLGVGYGGIVEPCDDACISPLHTHDPDGVIHTESPTPALNTLGQFLIEWGVELPADAKAYVNGHEHTGDIGAIELADGLEIAIVMGQPPAVIPSAFPPGLQ
jgi:hypothetical protein